MNEFKWYNAIGTSYPMLLKEELIKLRRKKGAKEDNNRVVTNNTCLSNGSWL